MSSFNINGPSNKPIIQGAQNLGQDGGGGGKTGYMRIRKKKKGQKNGESDDPSIIIEDEQEDTFTKQSNEEKAAQEEEKKSNKLLETLAGFIYKKEEDKPKDIFERSTKETFDTDNTDIAGKIFNKKIDDNYYDDIDI